MNEKQHKTGLATFRSTFTLYLPSSGPLQALSLPLASLGLSRVIGGGETEGKSRATQSTTTTTVAMKKEVSSRVFLADSLIGILFRIRIEAEED